MCDKHRTFLLWMAWCWHWLNMQHKAIDAIDRILRCPSSSVETLKRPLQSALIWKLLCWHDPRNAALCARCQEAKDDQRLHLTHHAEHFISYPNPTWSLRTRNILSCFCRVRVRQRLANFRACSQRSRRWQTVKGWGNMDSMDSATPTSLELWVASWASQKTSWMPLLYI